MLKQLILFFITLIISHFTLAQNGYDWQEPSFISTDLGGDTRGSSVLDNQDNLIVLGLFEDEVTIQDTVLYTSKDDGVFLAKYDEDHNLLWSKVIAEAKRENYILRRVLGGLDLKIDDDNNIYTIIHYTDTAYILNQEKVVDQSVVAYSNSIIVKVSNEGILDKFHEFNGSCPVGIGDVAIKDGLYFSIGFGPGINDTKDSCSCIINNDTLHYPFESTSMIGKLDEVNGAIEWKEHTKPIDKIELKDSSLYVSGDVFSSSDLIYKEDTMIVPESIGKYVFLMKLDKQGNFDWSTYIGVKGWDSYIISTDLVINTHNDILLGVNHSSQNTMNQYFFPNSPSLLGKDENDRSYLLVNYDSLGNIKWNDISNSHGYESHNGLTVDADHNIYSSSSFNWLILFGEDSIIPESGRDILLTSYTSEGTKRWYNHVSGTGSQYSWDLYLDNNEDLHLFGAGSGNIKFGSSNYSAPPGTGFYFNKLVKHPLSVSHYSSEAFEINVWPNPNRGNFLLELKDDNFEDVKIYNALGHIVKDYKPLKFDNSLNISGLSKGFYTIEIITETGKRASGKIIVE